MGVDVDGSRKIGIGSVKRCAGIGKVQLEVKPQIGNKPLCNGAEGELGLVNGKPCEPPWEQRQDESEMLEITCKVSRDTNILLKRHYLQDVTPDRPKNKRTQRCIGIVVHGTEYGVCIYKLPLPHQLE